MNHYRFLNVDFEPRHFAEFVYYKAIRLSLEFSVYERTSKPFWKMNLRDDLVLVPKFWNSCKWRVLKSSWHIYIYIMKKKLHGFQHFSALKQTYLLNLYFVGILKYSKRPCHLQRPFNLFLFNLNIHLFFLLPNSPVRYSNTAINEHG